MAERKRVLELVCGAVLVGLLAWFGYARFINGRRGEELNFSCFAYRDVNRNGAYDAGDRPYAGLEVEVQRPAGDTVTASSNISGFANFGMSSRRRSSPITEGGRYTFTVRAPKNWAITSGNVVQAVSFRRLEGAPVGIVADQTLVPVGVAPELTISGTVRIDGATSPPSAVAVRASSPSGTTTDIPVSASGTFSLPAEPGEWQLTFARGNGPAVTRTVNVRDCAVVLSRMELGTERPAIKPLRHRVDFDTLTTSDTLHEIPQGYAGLNWRNWVATHQKLYKSPGMINGTVSAEYFAYNSSGHPASIWSDRPFDLSGVYVGVAWPKAEAHDIEIKAWQGDRLVHADRLRGQTAGPVYFDADYRDVTRVEVSSAAYWQVVIDDLEFRTDGPNTTAGTGAPAGGPAAH